MFEVEASLKVGTSFIFQPLKSKRVLLWLKEQNVYMFQRDDSWDGLQHWVEASLKFVNGLKKCRESRGEAKEGRMCELCNPSKPTTLMNSIL